MNGFPEIVQNTRLGSFTRLEYVPTQWVTQSGFANRQGQWLGGITLQTGRNWLPINGVFGERALKNDVNQTPFGPVFTRRISSVLNADDASTQREFVEMAHSRFVLRGVMSDGTKWLLVTPQYPAMFAVSTDYGDTPQKMVKHSLSFVSVTPQPLYRWDY
jgi:hypothetical protein